MWLLSCILYDFQDRKLASPPPASGVGWLAAGGLAVWAEGMLAASVSWLGLADSAGWLAWAGGPLALAGWLARIVYKIISISVGILAGFCGLLCVG